MDTLLNDYLLNAVSNINHDFVRRLVTTAKKQEICTFVGHFICDHMLSNNIWFYTKIKEYFQLIEECKPNEKDKLSKLMYALFHLIGNGDKGIFNFHNPSEKSEMFADEIKKIRYTYGNTDNADLDQLRSVLAEESYILLNVLYDIFLYSVQSQKDIQTCFLILRYFLSLPPKQYLQGATRGVSMDIIDFVFLVCVWYSETSQCTFDLRNYIVLIKDIFYYKLKKKDKLLRINILFYLLYAIIQKQTSNQEIDYDGSTLTFDKNHIQRTKFNGSEDGRKANSEQNAKHIDDRVTEKCQYLFVYMDYDDKLKYEMDLERERLRMMTKLMRSSTKDVEVDSLLMRDPKNDVYVMKLS